MDTIAWLLLWFSAALVLYAYVGYPLLLLLLARLRHGPGVPAAADRAAAATLARHEWPTVTVCVPVYNERHQAEALAESLLAIEYPREKLQLLVISDASSDGTDDIIRGYAHRGIELVRQPRRAGKTAAEKLACDHIRGDIVVNTDASIRLHPAAVRHLVARLADPTVGVASGRDVSIARSATDSNLGESGYVGYEMTIRALETRVAGIIGASGCLYAIRAPLHRIPLPEHLSRDFASVLLARRAGYRAISVDEALCYVPRAGSLAREYGRKLRTLSRGIETLHHLRALLNPLRYGLFAWMLFSHKVCRWAAPWAVAAGILAVAALAPDFLWARLALAPALVIFALGGLGWTFASRRHLPRLLSVPAFVLAGNLAAMHAVLAAAFGRRSPIWEPTRREVVAAP